MPDYIAALDQGTTSSRCLIFNGDGKEVSRHQLEHRQILPCPGWVEHDAAEILERTIDCLRGSLWTAGLEPEDLAAIGITNQRETSVVWDRRSGKPLYAAIVWQDMRTEQRIQELEREGRKEFIRGRTGLPPATYFSAAKLQWILEESAEVRDAVSRGDARFGTIDSWLIWNLTGGTRGGLHVTDVTNASRTQLMNLATGDWDPELLDLFHVPRGMLPEIRPSNARAGYGPCRLPEFHNAPVPVAAALGDQQAALVGQVCFAPGEAKNTYGTGNFLLLNTGQQIVPSRHGLLSTAAYQWEGHPVTYALEGSVAVTGSAVQWLRDQMGLIQTASEIESLANQVTDAGGLCFVPAFSGLFAPYWRSDARGAIVGLSRFHTRAHLARATLEAICYQTKDVLDAMVQDSGMDLKVLRVDGGATVNDTLMQLQADILGVEVVRPRVPETTALGAAYAAGLAVGFWPSTDELRKHWEVDRRWEPQWSEDRRAEGHARWHKAVERTFAWTL